MEEQRNIIVNEGDTRKLDIFTQGDLSVSPTGIPIMASDANGTIRILKQDDKGNLNVNMQVGNVTATIGGTMAVYFDQSAPTVNATGAGGSISVNVVAGGAGGGVAQTQVRNAANVWTDVGYAANQLNVPVYIAGSAASSSLQIIGITNTIGVRFSDEPYVVTEGKYGATKIATIHNTDGALKIYDIANGTVTVNAGSGTMGVRVQQIDGTVGVYFSQSEPTVKIKNETSGTINIKFNSEPTVIDSGKDGTTTRPLRMNSDGAIKVYDLAAGTVSISGYSGSVGVYIDTWKQTGAVRVGQVDGTVAVYFSQSNPKVNLGVDIINCAHTASIASAGGSVSGSTSGISVSGVQIVAPEANRVIKVFALALSTTAQVHLTSKFTNGSGGSPVELWRYGLQAPSQGMAGANLAVTPPGYLFATPSGATLCIVLDSASLVHYSISYFKESA